MEQKFLTIHHYYILVIFFPNLKAMLQRDYADFFMIHSSAIPKEKPEHTSLILKC
jgi:hypothetical protein